MTNFTPFSALAGGILIGAAAILLLALNGRIAGISTIFGKMFVQKNGFGWRLSFIVGLILGAFLFYQTSHIQPISRTGFPHWLLVMAGLFVGYGTAMSNGCTSGHGVCGLGRFSLRSLAATLTFLLCGIISTYVVRHIAGIF